VEAGSTRVLIEAGLSLRETRRRAGLLGVSLDTVEAVVVTHEHTDHVAHAARLSRGLEAPLLLNRRTEIASARFLKGKYETRHFVTGETVVVGDLEIVTLRKPHDAADPVTVLVRHGRQTLGIFTDLGHVDEANGRALAECTHLFIEANHDPGLLERGPYPQALKRRVASRVGHLSNDDAARAVREAAPRLDLLILGHVSEKNNHGGILRRSFVRALGKDPGYPRWVSRQDRPTPLFGADGQIVTRAATSVAAT
jgi:phosphoribosyl 1,2-cyclic phosphodiesterase